MRNLGIDQNDLRKRHGTIFAVRKVVADYLKPAIFEDQLTVVTSPQSVTSARLILNQDVMRGDMLLFRAEVTLVYLSPSGRPLRLPSAVLAAATVGAVKLAGTI